MTSLSDGNPLQQPDADASTQTLNVRKTRSPTRNEPPETSTTSLPIRSTSPPSLASRSNTFIDNLSRSSSPDGRLSLSVPRFGRSTIANSLTNPSESYDELRSIIVRAFSPTVAVYPTQDLDDLARLKGVPGGFTDLIRPYGEKIQGKVVVRDSVGASRAWDDFTVHVTDLGSIAYDAASPLGPPALAQLEELLENIVESEENEVFADGGSADVSPLYKLFLRRLLRSHKISPHEAFVHPVATVIAISSATQQPIETLRHLYQQTAQGARTLPPYSNPEYLRYYVLVHDEDRDDPAKSSALFDQMKRHFGLHCHLLRLRSTSARGSDEATEALPQCEWLSPAEDLQRLSETSNLVDLHENTSTSIYASDASAIRTFLRELVAQSIVPHMEQRIMLWNEQVASRRRGISGRFMSLSKRWAGIGSSARNASSATSLTASGASGNYDSVQNSYRYDTPEATLRKLADYAFMLRDYKLAASTLELVRSDYSNDKAWKYLAGADEMCYVANLLNPLTGTASAKMKMENFDQMLEAASYSYLTRCSDPTSALRSMILGVELLKVRGKLAAEIAAKWAIRILELALVGSCGHVLISERVASCFASQIGIGNAGWGTRRRKAALWNVMAADEWVKLGRAELAAERLDEAQELYAESKHGEAMKQFTEMDTFVNQLSLAVKMKLGQGRHRGLSGASLVMQQEVEDETVEDMGGVEKLDGKMNRRSVMGDLPPLSPTRSRGDPLGVRDDDFE